MTALYRCAANSKIFRYVQLYVKGEFIGGADIVEEMNDKGELKPLLL